MNGSIIQILRSYTDQNKNEWAKYLPYALFAIRSTENPAIGCTPFEMLYGRTPRLPGEQGLITQEPIHVNDYVRNVKIGLQQLHSDARKRLKDAFEAHYNKPAQNNLKKFEQGDLVMVKREHHALGKFENRWEGPYEVLKVNPRDSYKINRPCGPLGRTTSTIHADRLKKYTQRSENEEQTDKKEL
jgi:ribosomal protein L21E